MLLLGKSSIYETRRVVQWGFAAVLVLVLIYAITSLYQIRKSTNHLTEIVEINNSKITHLYNMRDVIRQRQIILNQMRSTKDFILREENSLVFFSIAGGFREGREQLQALVDSDKEKIILEDLVRKTRIAQPINQKAVSEMVSNFGSVHLDALLIQAQEAQSEILGVMKRLITLQKQYEIDYVADSKKGYEQVFFWSVFSALFIVSLAIIISKIVSDYVAKKNIELVNKNIELKKVSELALEATRTKSAFLATMSHEIRTPLTAIIGFAEMNVHDVIPQENKKRYSESIVRNGKHLLQVINDILDISKLEADRIEFEKEKYSPFKIMQEVEQVLLPQLNKKELFLELSYDYPIPEFIIGDELRFKQVILNLCSNAVKFTESGRINIKTSCDFKAEKLTVEVVDTGIGMTDQQVGKIFEAFTQADSSVTRKYGGTGLGLALTKQFVQKMGGDIEAHSLLGIGSRFVVHIETGNISTVKTIHSAPSNNLYVPVLEHKAVLKQVSGRILLAEDNPDNQQLFKLLLEKAGAEVRIVENGKDAVDTAMSESFDLIFMDMQMPIMDGVEAIRILRSKGYIGAIVSLTANAMKQDREACFAAGCNDYITKPVSENLLYNTVREYLDVIDTERVVSTNEVSMDADVIALKDKFIANLPLKIDLIHQSFRQAKFKDMKSEVHKLKGLGSSIGYPEVTNICLEIEQSLQRNDTYQCENLIVKLESIIKGIVKHRKENKA